MPDPVLVLCGAAVACAAVGIASLALNGGAYAALPLRMGSSGYWGHVSSSIDWCEENYTHSHYVAEIHNTVSGATGAVAGAIGMACCYKCGAELRFALVFLMLAITGIGTVCFHGALQRWMQILDEVPMLWLIVAVIFCVYERNAAAHGGRQYGLWLPLVLVAWATVVSCVAVLVHGPMQVACFQSSFACALLVALYGIYK
eukprot:TRINITY_DN4322_c0_g1_i2.p2 TRINITY_DN4322_c0_g1~~TRINITY_DN4322_c0_g1_i2.p2  ORF type:complete len:201 (-),score=30.41 TRINITY_DN4322_c0_g1_i2:893-1495(-)